MSDQEIIPPAAGGTAPALDEPTPPLRTPLRWRIAILAGVVSFAATAWVLQEAIGTRGQALAGVFCFFGLVALFSANLRLANWRTIGWGFGLQHIAWQPVRIAAESNE